MSRLNEGSVCLPLFLNIPYSYRTPICHVDVWKTGYGDVLLLERVSIKFVIKSHNCSWNSNNVQ